MKVILFTHTKAPILARTQVTAAIWWMLDCLGYQLDPYPKLPRTAQGKPYLSSPIPRNQARIKTEIREQDKVRDKVQAEPKIYLVALDQFLVGLQANLKLDLEQFFAIITKNSTESNPDHSPEPILDKAKVNLLAEIKIFTKDFFAKHDAWSGLEANLNLVDFSLSHSENLFACSFLLASDTEYFSPSESETKSLDSELEDKNILPSRDLSQAIIGCDIEQLSKIRLKVLQKVTNSNDEFRKQIKLDCCSNLASVIDIDTSCSQADSKSSKFDLSSKTNQGSNPLLIDLLEWTQREAIIKAYASSIFYATRFQRDSEGNFYLNDFLTLLGKEQQILNPDLSLIGTCLSLVAPLSETFAHDSNLDSNLNSRVSDGKDKDESIPQANDSKSCYAVSLLLPPEFAQDSVLQSLPIKSKQRYSLRELAKPSLTFESVEQELRHDSVIITSTNIYLKP